MRRKGLSSKSAVSSPLLLEEKRVRAEVRQMIRPKLLVKMFIDTS